LSEKEYLCKPVSQLCAAFDELISKSDYNDETRVLVSASRFPQGASWRSFSHYAQEISSDKFERYDFGLTANLRIYGQKTPPEIDISVIDKVPVAMFVGKQDTLADMEDAKWAAKNIPSTVHF
jgi:lysosomal acid lipase/cholesteryl ester hydrolase